MCDGHVCECSSKPLAILSTPHAPNSILRDNSRSSSSNIQQVNTADLTFVICQQKPNWLGWIYLKLEPVPWLGLLCLEVEGPGTRHTSNARDKATEGNRMNPVLYILFHTWKNCELAMSSNPDTGLLRPRGCLYTITDKTQGPGQLEAYWIRLNIWKKVCFFSITRRNI